MWREFRLSAPCPHRFGARYGAEHIQETVAAIRDAGGEVRFEIDAGGALRAQLNLSDAEAFHRVVFNFPHSDATQPAMRQQQSPARGVSGSLVCPKGRRVTANHSFSALCPLGG